MKKQLLNRKTLSQFFYSLTFTLLFANLVSAQIILSETFGSTAVPIANNYAGGTSSPSVNYITNTAGYSSVGTDTFNTGFLNFISNTTAPATTTGVRVSLSGTLPINNATGLNEVLKSNTKLITWTFNMKSSRLSTNTFSTSTGYPINKYFSAFVLCSTTSDLLSNGANPGDGYVVTVQKSSNNSISGKASINLIKFTHGIGDASSAGTEKSVITRLIESPELAQIPISATTSNNLSIKVTYNPTIDVWELYYREDAIATSPITMVDPSTTTTGDFTLGGSYTDLTVIPTAIKNFGYVVGLQASASTANSYQFDNLKIGLSDPPPYTAPPTVLKRQIFDINDNPKVANLAATGISGAKFNWYNAATLGTALAESTPLSYANYYVSQTVNGTESTRVATQVFVGNTTLKTLPFYENFDNYIIDDKLILMNFNSTTGVGLGSWTLTPSTNVTDDVVIKANSPTGNGIGFVGSGIDPELKFTPTTTGNLFSSFTFTAVDPNDGKTPPTLLLVNAQKAADDVALGKTPPDPTPVTLATGIDASKSTPTGIYSFYFETTDPLTSVVSSGYASSVMFRKNIANGNFNLGLSKSNNGGECVWSDVDYSFGTKYTIVISYENIGDATATSQVANLWVNPDTTSKPIPTLTQSTPTTSVTRSNIDRIKLLQASSTSTPSLVIDDIRVATTWDSTVVLGLQQVSKSQCTVYPNPVSNGKLYISSPSNSQKQVAIYSILGQKVLEAKTTNNAEINVSKLAKGNYILKITEDGKSDAKKLIIQ